MTTQTCLDACRRALDRQRQSWPQPTTPRPSLAQLMQWDEEGYALATDDCPVEPDGTCPHGHPSWLLWEGMI